MLECYHQKSKNASELWPSGFWFDGSVDFGREKEKRSQTENEVLVALRVWLTIKLTSGNVA